MNETQRSALWRKFVSGLSSGAQTNIADAEKHGRQSITKQAFEYALAASPVQAGAVLDGWRTIESAPKDGRQIILTNGTSVAQGWWEHQEPFIREKRDVDGRYIDQEEGDGYDGWIDCDGGMLPDPTHWMPLPAAPGSPPAKMRMLTEEEFSDCCYGATKNAAIRTWMERAVRKAFAVNGLPLEGEQGDGG